MNANVVSIIPKIHGATSIKYFKPIAVANLGLKSFQKS